MDAHDLAVVFVRVVEAVGSGGFHVMLWTQSTTAALALRHRAGERVAPGLARLSDGIVFPLLQRELDAIRTLGTLVVVTAQEAGVVLAPAGADAHPVEWRSGGRAHSDRSY